METKICSKCKIEKPFSGFNKGKSKKDGLFCWCKSCCKQYHKDNKLQTAESRKWQGRQYYMNNALRIAKRENSAALFEVYFERLGAFEKIQRCPENLELLEVKCAYCGKWMPPTNLQVKNRLRAFNNTGYGECRFYCSIACKEVCPTFKKQTRWEGQNETDSKRLGTSREVGAWFRQYVLETDNWTCQKCGASKEEDQELVLHVHHIKGVAQEPMLQNDIDNAITLCVSCHKETHETKGCTYFDFRRPKYKSMA